MNVPAGVILNNVNNLAGISLANGVLVNNSGLTLAGTLSSGTVLTQTGGTLSLVPSNFIVASSSANIVSPLLIDRTAPLSPTLLPADATDLVVQSDPGTVAPQDTTVAPELTFFQTPEPSSILSLAVGAAILLGRRRRAA